MSANAPAIQYTRGGADTAALRLLVTSYWRDFSDQRWYAHDATVMTLAEARQLFKGSSVRLDAPWRGLIQPTSAYTAVVVEVW